MSLLEKHNVDNPSKVPEFQEKKFTTLNNLKNRPTVLEIRKYKEKYDLKLMNSWYYKKQEVLDAILKNLKTTYGELAC